VKGHDLAKDFLSIRKSIGFLPDFFNLYNDLTLRECLRFFAAAYKVESASIPGKVEQALEYVELTDKADDFIRNLSRGMVQRLGLAAKLVHSPEIFLLDEPASGLDPKARIQMRDILKRLSSEGSTIVISSHILTELSGFCTHIALMDRGKMKLYGSIDRLAQTAGRGRILEIKALNDIEKARSIIASRNDCEIDSVFGNTIRCRFGATDEEIARINRDLIGAGIMVAGVTEKKTNLEDLFMRLSGGNEGGME
jgi:ABC-2 type transport system ATP-binding protein